MRSVLHECCVHFDVVPVEAGAGEEMGNFYLMGAFIRSINKALTPSQSWNCWSLIQD